MKRLARHFAFVFVAMALASACDSRQPVKIMADAPNVPPQKVTVPAGKSVQVDWSFQGPGGASSVRLVLQKPPDPAVGYVEGQSKQATYPMDTSKSWELDISGLMLFPTNKPIPRFRSSTKDNVTTYEYAMDDNYSPVLLTVAVTLLPP